MASKSTLKRPEFSVWHQPHSFAFIMTTPRGFTTFRLPMVPGMAAPSPRRSDYKRHSVFDIKQGKSPSAAVCCFNLCSDGFPRPLNPVTQVFLCAMKLTENAIRSSKCSSKR